MSDQKAAIVCLPWRLRHISPQLAGVKRVCALCGEDVVMHAGNAEPAKNMMIVCAPCVVKYRPNAVPDGGMINGEKIKGIGPAIRAAERYNQRN